MARSRHIKDMESGILDPDPADWAPRIFGHAEQSDHKQIHETTGCFSFWSDPNDKHSI